MTETTRAESCLQCKFWNALFEGKIVRPRYRDTTPIGECRFMPPAIVGIAERFPITKTVDWCGQFKKRGVKK